MFSVWIHGKIKKERYRCGIQKDSGMSILQRRGGDFIYTTTQHTASITVPEYMERFVDIPTFLNACKVCPNYDHLWSCPPYDFDVEVYWRCYHTLYLYATEIIFDEKYRDKTYTSEEMQSLLDSVLPAEKQKLSDMLMKKEKAYPGSISLSAGCCQKCSGGCTRTSGKPCRQPEAMRYSIEALGGNVGMTIEKLMGLKLEWMEEGRLPHHFVLVSGLLIPKL